MKIKTLKSIEKKVESFLRHTGKMVQGIEYFVCASTVTETEDHITYNVVGYNLHLHQTRRAWTDNSDILMMCKKTMSGIVYCSSENPDDIYTFDEAKKIVIDYLTDKL